MTISRKPTRCEWCGGEFASSSGPGRPARYCRRSHRQRAYEARRLAGDRGIKPDEVLISRRTWVSLRDALYRLEAASEDVTMDLQGGHPTKAEYADAITHLSAAAGELGAIPIEPIAFG